LLLGVNVKQRCKGGPIVTLAATLLFKCSAAVADAAEELFIIAAAVDSIILRRFH